jgi:glycerol uptake facilitator-like aquaporin
LTLLGILIYHDLTLSRIAKQYSALAVGLVYAVGIYCEGPYTGGSMNPARTLAAAVAFWDFTGMWISLVFLHGGAIVGAFVYKNSFSINQIDRFDRSRKSKDSEIRYI